MPTDATSYGMVCVSQPKDSREPHPCPVCGGGLVPLRGSWRCGRCAFVVCVGCEAGYGGSQPEED